VIFAVIIKNESQVYIEAHWPGTNTNVNQIRRKVQKN